MSAHRIKIKAPRPSVDPFTQQPQTASAPTTELSVHDLTGARIDHLFAGTPSDFDPPVAPPPTTAAPSHYVLDPVIAKIRDSYRPELYRKPDATRPDAPTDATPPVQPASPGHSTGPRTPEGKARSSQNALKHGLTMPTGSLTFLRSEDSSGYTRLILQFNEQFVPMTGAEREVIREIVDSLWLARRARDLQTEALDISDHHALALYLRYETAHQRAHNAAIKTLLTLQKDRRQRNQNHEQWEEPILWGNLDYVLVDDSAPATSSPAQAAATTSAASTDSTSSFRNGSANSPRGFTTTAQRTPQTAANSTSKEENPAA
jgi:hypothetical protein